MKSPLVSIVLFASAMLTMTVVALNKLMEDVPSPLFSAQYSCIEPAEMKDVGEAAVWSFDNNPEGQALFYVSPLERGEFTLFRAVPFDQMGTVTVMENGGVIFETSNLRVGLQDRYLTSPEAEVEK